jgi:hypothetical protein
MHIKFSENSEKNSNFQINSSAIFRLVMCIIHFYFTIWIFQIWGFKIKTFLFMTNISFFLNYFYFGIKALFTFRIQDVIDFPEGMNFLNTEKFSNSLLKFCFSLSIVVIILYWALIIFAPDLLNGTDTPLVLDFFLHGGNLTVLVIDCMLNKFKVYVDHQNITINLLMKISIGYILIQYFVYYTMNIEVYPLISKLNFIQFSIFGMVGFFLLGLSSTIFDKIYVKTNID